MHSSYVTIIWEVIQDMKLEIFKCDRCGKEMEYGEAEIHCCVNDRGIEFDYCTKCFEKFTKDTDEITNLIVR